MRLALFAGVRNLNLALVAILAAALAPRDRMDAVVRDSRPHAGTSRTFYWSIVGWDF